MKYLILFIMALPVYGYQNCKFKVLVNPVNKNIAANKITNGNGDDIAIDDFNINLNLTPAYVRKKVWRCRFKKKVKRNRIYVKYTLVATNGQSNGISNGGFFIPTEVTTKRLRINNNRKVVKGDVKFKFDLGGAQATSSGNYTGVLTIEVYEN